MINEISTGLYITTLSASFLCDINYMITTDELNNQSIKNELYKHIFIKQQDELFSYQLE